MLLSTQGPFPPRTLPRFPGTTDPSATLTARPAPRGVPVDLCCISVRASRVAALFLFHACRRQYPDGNGSVPVSLASPSANGLPLLTGGSTSVLPVSRPARRSLAFRPAWSLNRPRRPFFTRVLQSMSLPPWPALAATNRSDSCWAGFAPARRRRLSTAHCQTWANTDSKNPLPSSWITSHAHPIIEPVSFLCSSFSSCLSCLSCLSMFPNTTNRFNGNCPYSPKDMKIRCFTLV